MKQSIYLVIILTFFVACEADFNVQKATNLCENVEMENFISVKATNIETGEGFNKIYVDNIFVSCVSGEEIRTFEDGTMRSRIYYNSGLMQDRSSRSLTDIQISFEHDNSCDETFPDVSVEFVSLKMELAEGVYKMSIRNPEIGFGSGRISVMTSSELLSYGQDSGDIIEGSIFAESVGAGIIDSLGNVLVSPQSSTLLYTLEFCFKVVLD